MTRFTHSDLRVINEALALLEAEVESQSGYDESTFDADAEKYLEVVQDVRSKVHERIKRAGIQL